jgi:hypothetical protein
VEQVPAWARDYIGIEFTPRGRTRQDGLDCWGLIRLVYAEQYAIMLPSLDAVYTDVGDAHGVAEVVSACIESSGNQAPQWVPTEQPRSGDLVRFDLAHGLVHVGLVLAPNQMLHAYPGCDSCFERFDRPSWQRRFRCFLRYAGGVQFRGMAQRVTLPHGGTVREIVKAAGLTETASLRVWIAGREIERAHWDWVRPRPGKLVSAAVVPEGGGKDAARLLATIAIVAGAVALPGAIGITGAFASAALTAAAGIGGTLLLNALIPPSRQSLGNSEAISRFSISGTRNQARQFEAIPFVAGVRRMAPPYGAAPFVENDGDDQYLRVLFCPSYGPVEFSDFKIGNTPLDEYEGVEIETRPGRDDDDPIALYPNTILEDSYSVLLDNDAGWVTRTTRVDTDEISIDLTWPRGLVRLSSSGGSETTAVSLEVEFSPVGAGTWTPINDDSPGISRGLDLMFREPECPRQGTGLHTGAVEWGLGFADAKPAYLSASDYAWMATGRIYAPTAGDYVFAIDGSDACDLVIRGRTVVSWYGTHAPVGGIAAAPDYSAHQGTINLSAGWHPFRVRMECRSNTGAIAVGWKKPGDGSFTTVPAANLEPTSTATGDLRYLWHDTSRYAGSIVVESDRTDQLRRSIAWAVPRGQYDVRVRRITTDSDDDRVIDEVYLTAVRSIRNEDPIRLARVAKIALRIKATDQLSGVIDDFNCMVSSVCQDYDEASGTWIERVTSTPASLYRHVLQGPAIRRPLADARLSLTDLEQWAIASRAKGLEINQVFATRSTVYETLSAICAAGMASFGMLDGKFGVVRDVVQTIPVQHFTPRNSRGFRGLRSFTRPPHGLRVRFVNKDKGYDDDERIVLADGYQIDGRDAFDQLAPTLTPATEFETMDLPGVVTWEEVFKHARYNLAVLKLRPETYEIETDFEHLVCTRGDLVLVTHDVPLFGLVSGRIARQVLDASNNLVMLALDEPVTMDASDSYSIRVRLETGESWVRGVVTVEGVTDTLTLGGPISPGVPRPTAGDLFAFGRSGQESRECIVKAIDPSEDLAAKLTLLDHAPGIALAADGEIPPYDPGISDPADYVDRPETPVIDSIRSDDLVMIRDADGSLRNRMLITLRRPSSTRPLGTTGQVRTRPLPPGGGEAIGPWQNHPYQPIANQQLSVLDVQEGTTYEIRLRTSTIDGRASNWASAQHTVIGKSALPPDLLSADVSVISDGTRRYSWLFDGEVPPDLAGVLIRYGLPGASWSSMTALTSEPIEASPFESVQPPASFWEFAFKSIDTSGNESAGELRIQRTLTDPRLEDIAFSVDCARTGWTGTKTGCHVAGLVLEADDSTTWATMPATWDGNSRWNNRPTSPIFYEHVLDAGSLLNFSPDAVAAGEGQITVEVAWSTDGVSYTAFAAVAGVRSLIVQARYLKARVSCNLLPSALVPVISSLIILMRSRPIVHEVQDLVTSNLNPDRRIAVGDIRIPVPAGRFTVIRGLTLGFNGVGGGWTWELVDRDVVLGPRVRLYNTYGVLADATIDAVVRGF